MSDLEKYKGCLAEDSANGPSDAAACSLSEEIDRAKAAIVALMKAIPCPMTLREIVELLTEKDPAILEIRVRRILEANVPAVPPANENAHGN